MAKSIYNEGRVVGLTAYEIYVKQHLADDPDSTPASEREWLASSLAMGASVLMQVPAISPTSGDITILDIEMPASTRLCAANTIIASFFNGDAHLAEGSQFADRVTDYGGLIANNATNSPSGSVNSADDIPEQSDMWTDTRRAQLDGYMRILDGIILHPGEWVDSESTPPQKDFIPDMSGHPTIRLQIKGQISTPFFILLTGFSLKGVVVGQTGIDGGSTSTASPQDGDFLGPACFPWANKIIFSTPSAVMNYLVATNYTREIPTGESPATVSGSSIIDMKSNDPGNFYSNPLYQSARVPITVEDYSSWDDTASVLTVYQRDVGFPAALYATYVQRNGAQFLNPVDIVAPGTVKIIPNAEEAQLESYESLFPGTTAIGRNDDGSLSILDSEGNLVTIAYVYYSDLAYENPANSSETAQAAVITAGKSQVSALAMSDETGNPYPISKKPSLAISLNEGNSENNLSWALLLEALANDKAIDLLGNDLKSAKQSLPTNYITFGLGGDREIRLYISPTEPTDANIPIGSIGIGWAEDSND